MSEWLLVAGGGAVGAVARLAVSGFVQKRVGAGFPLGTLVVNVLGCLLLGVVMEVVVERELFSPRVRALVAVGLLGSFTTFSTFGYETLELLRSGAWPSALANVGLNVVVGLLAVLSGILLVRGVLDG